MKTTKELKARLKTSTLYNMLDKIEELEEEVNELRYDKEFLISEVEKYVKIIKELKQQK